jgi:hypothetical protein
MRGLLRRSLSCTEYNRVRAPHWSLDEILPWEWMFRSELTDFGWAGRGVAKLISQPAPRISHVGTLLVVSVMYLGLTRVIE